MSGGLALALGALAGGHVASWGAHKDLPYEGFRLRAYLRSPLLAVAVALVVGAVLPEPQRPGAAVIALGVIYAMERLATEWWKAIVRKEPQDRYTIPMRLAVAGRPVRRRGARYGAGVVLAAALGASAWALTLAAHRFPAASPWLITLVVGGAGGCATAIGGAWKDAPIEGFSLAKFLRSPLVATAWALPLSLLTTSWLALCLAAAGYAVAGIETYKTFLTRGRPPGKFAGQPIRHHHLRLRRGLAGMHAGLWAAFAVALTGTFSRVPAGLTARAVARLSHPLPALLLGTVAFAAGSFAVLVAMLTRPRTTGETP